jgi:hypothetical protein
MNETAGSRSLLFNTPPLSRSPITPASMQPA